MSNERQLHGQATIRFNGQVYESEAGATLTRGGLKNNPRMVGKKFHYNQTYIQSTLTCRIAKTKGLSLQYLQEMNGVEIHFESDIGETYIIRHAAQTGEVALAGGDDGGMVDLTFNGEPAEEMSV